MEEVARKKNAIMVTLQSSSNEASQIIASRGWNWTLNTKQVATSSGCVFWANISLWDYGTHRSLLGLVSFHLALFDRRRRSNTTEQTRSISSEISRSRKKCWKRVKKLSRCFCFEVPCPSMKNSVHDWEEYLRPCSINIAVSEPWSELVDRLSKSFWKRENVGRKWTEDKRRKHLPA